MAPEPSHPESSSLPNAWPGEPGVTTDRGPPFVAGDDATRWLFSLNRFGIRPGLRRINGLLAELGHPEQQVPTLVVAGTNGKGSTTRILATLLQHAGYRVGCFTSPHLLRVHERITINEQPVGEATLAEKIEKLRPAVETHEASWFETLTALALDISRDEQVELLCCETGLGGRLDATNALPALATLLVSVSSDHCSVLGRTLPEIVTEKLGLLKRNTPLFCGVGKELRPQVFQSAVTAGSPCHFLDELVRWEMEGEHWQLITRHAVIPGLPTPSAPVLVRNMALALLCLEELAVQGVLRSPPDPATALTHLFLPGCFQQVFSSPDWVFDTAHNSVALCTALDAYRDRPCRGRRWILFGCMQDKELGSEVGERLRDFDGVVAAPINLPRSRNLSSLMELLKTWRIPVGDRLQIVPDIQTAIVHLARVLKPADTVLVTGSCFLVAEVLYCMGVRDLNETREVRPAAKVLAAFDSTAGGGEPVDC